ncbi:MAG: hypothetical protein PVG56_02970 [Anaerolineae bacterium]|jgi:hypothetical protein
MEYLINSDEPFHTTEARTIEALQCAGFVVQCTFRLVPPAPDGKSNGDCRDDPGYTVLMLYRSDPPQSPLGLVILYGRGGQVVLKPLLELPAMGETKQPGKIQDVEAELAAALSGGGLDFCVYAARGRDCINLDSLKEIDQ